MKFHSSYVGSLAAICSKEYTRYAINAPQLDVEKAVIVATNGHALVVIPVTVLAEEKSGSVDLRALKFYMAAHKLWRKNKLSFSRANQPKEPTLECGEKTVFVDTDGTRMEYPRATGDYPKWETTIPEFKGRTVCLNPTYLRDLAVSMNHGVRTDGIVLWVPDNPAKGIGVCSITRTNLGLGVLMPMRGDVKAPAIDKFER